MIKGFWHIYMVSLWHDIVQEQIKILLSSGLYEECDEVNIGCIGSMINAEKLMRSILPYPKLKIRFHSVISEKFEFPTLQLIEQTPGDFVGFYFHLKGVTKPRDGMQFKERLFLNEIMLNQWRTHKSIIDAGYDISSVNYLSIPSRFSGNYFWFNRKRIERLPRLKTVDQTNRYNAEYWIYMSK
jgi:hypothetical protein